MRLALGSAAIAGAAAGVVLYGVKGRSAQVFGPSVYRGPKWQRSIALTFDDGPSEGSLDLIVLLRAPYGMRWFGMHRTQQRLGLLGVMWTVIGHDWEWPSSRVADFVLGKAAPGGIVCLHDGRDVRPDPDIRETVQAVRRIVPVLKQQGYSFATVSQLLSS